MRRIGAAVAFLLLMIGAALGQQQYPSPIFSGMTLYGLSGCLTANNASPVTTVPCFPSGGVTGPASAVAGDAAAFSGTTGKIIQDSGKAFPSGAIVGTTDTQTLTNKSIAVTQLTGLGSGVLALLVGYGDPTGAADSTSSLNIGIATAIASGYNGISLLPGGTYRVSKSVTSSTPALPNSAVLINNATNFILECNGARILVDGNDAVGTTPWSTGISIQNATGKVTIKDCNVSQEVPYYVQGTFTSKTATTATFSLTAGTIPSAWGFIQRLEEFKYTFPNTLNGKPVWDNTPVTSTADTYQLVNNGGGSYTITGLNSTQTGNIDLTTGNVYVITRAVFGFDGIDVYNSSAVVFDNTVVNLAGIGFYTLSAANVTMQNGSGTRLDPALAQNLRTTNGNIFQNARGASLIKDSVFEDEGDDAVNCAATDSLVVTKNSSTNITVVLPYPFVPYQTGDQLELVDTTGAIDWTGSITSAITVASGQMTFSVTPSLPSGLGAAITAGSFVVGSQYTIASIGSTNFTLIGASANTVGLTFTATGVGTGTGTAVAVAYTGDRTALGPWEVKNNRMAYIRGHGVYGNGVQGESIHDNTLSYTSNGIQLASNMTYFAQGPVPQNVSIHDNDMLHVNYNSQNFGAIQVINLNTSGSIEAPGVSGNNISISDNFCKYTGANCIYVGGAGTIDVSGNSIVMWNQDNIINWHSLGNFGVAYYNVAGFTAEGNSFGQSNSTTPGGTFGGGGANSLVSILDCGLAQCSIPTLVVGATARIASETALIRMGTNQDLRFLGPGGNLGSGLSVTAVNDIASVNIPWEFDSSLFGFFGGPARFGTSINFASVAFAAAAPTITSGFGGGTPTISAPNGTASFDVTTGTASGSTGVLALPTAANAWNCTATDVTTPATTVTMTAHSVSAVTLTASATWGAGADVAIQCAAH